MEYSGNLLLINNLKYIALSDDEEQEIMHGYLRYTGALKIKVWLVLLIQYAMFMFYPLKFVGRRLGSILVMAACHGIKQL